MFWFWLILEKINPFGFKKLPFILLLYDFCPPYQLACRWSKDNFPPLGQVSRLRKIGKLILIHSILHPIMRYTLNLDKRIRYANTIGEIGDGVELWGTGRTKKKKVKDIKINEISWGGVCHAKILPKESWIAHTWERFVHWVPWSSGDQILLHSVFSWCPMWIWVRDTISFLKFKYCRWIWVGEVNNTLKRMDNSKIVCFLWYPYGKFCHL